METELGKRFVINCSLWLMVSPANKYVPPPFLVRLYVDVGIYTDTCQTATQKHKLLVMCEGNNMCPSPAVFVRPIGPPHLKTPPVGQTNRPATVCGMCEYMWDTMKYVVV